MWETWVQSLAGEDPLEKEMATHPSTLAWKIPWTEKADRLQSTVHGWQRVGHDWATSLSLSCPKKSFRLHWVILFEAQSTYSLNYVNYCSPSVTLLRGRTLPFIFILLLSAQCWSVGSCYWHIRVFAIVVQSLSHVGLCNPVNCSTPGFPVLHYLLEFWSDSCPLSQWCYLTTSSSVIPFSCPQSFLASRPLLLAQWYLTFSSFWMIDICVIQLKVIGYTHTLLSKLKKNPAIDLNKLKKS